MTLNPIYHKEWLKLARYSLGLATLALTIGIYFYLDLVGQFANIEPESMMWYRFAHLGDKPYSSLQLVFIANAGLIAALQYVPEALGKRVRILTHLPLPLTQVVVAHLVSGIGLILSINGLLGIIILLTVHANYPIEIVEVTLKDLTFGQLPAISLYLGLAASIIESRWVYRAVKLALGLLITFSLCKEHYTNVDLLWLGVIGWMWLPLKDSFLSVKTRRIQGPIYKAAIPVIFCCLLFVSAVDLHQQYGANKSKYYVFYSNLLQDFVYQKNGENHTFFYGTPSAKLNKAEFETALPFVYWKNLDIQGKLPIEVEGKHYDKHQIRTSRMSLQYAPDRFNNIEAQLYPLFNPISHLGSIRFPEVALTTSSDRFIAYQAETAKPDPSLSMRLNSKASAVGLRFPIRSVWGKTTNMKPFDWGYFVKDDAGKIYNLGMTDDQIYVKPVTVPAGIQEIEYIQVSENRQKLFYGYAIDTQSQVFLIRYPDYQFVQLDLDGFNHHTMSFQLLSDPLNYLVRYDDGHLYQAVLFDKDLTKLGSVNFD
ncbi:DUF4857 domain-containing protein [Vibrio sp. WXL210]|uniref:DUF4857 domain-containing protein n=1 Tax=Vibrio sp. WXL210 TaxID=3450709 RepID=UPI003EC69193